MADQPDNKPVQPEVAEGTGETKVENPTPSPAHTEAYDRSSPNPTTVINEQQLSQEVKRILGRFAVVGDDASKAGTDSRWLLGGEEHRGFSSFGSAMQDVTRTGDGKYIGRDGKPLSSGEINIAFRHLVKGALTANPNESPQHLVDSLNESLKGSGFEARYDADKGTYKLVDKQATKPDGSQTERELSRFKPNESPKEYAGRMADRFSDMSPQQQEAFIKRGISTVLKGMTDIPGGLSADAQRANFIKDFNDQLRASGNTDQTLALDPKHGAIIRSARADRAITGAAPAEVPENLRLPGKEAVARQYRDLSGFIQNAETNGKSVSDIQAELKKVNGASYGDLDNMAAGLNLDVKEQYGPEFGVRHNPNSNQLEMTVKVPGEPPMDVAIPPGMNAADAQKYAKAIGDLRKINPNPADGLQQRISDFMRSPQGSELMKAFGKMPDQAGRQQFVDTLNASLPNGDYKFGINSQNPQNLDVIQPSNIFAARFSDQVKDTIRQPESEQRRKTLSDNAPREIQGANRDAFADSIISLEKTWGDPTARANTLKAIETQLKSIPEGTERTAYLNGINDAAMRLQGNPKDGVTYKMERGSLQPVNFTTVKDGNGRDVKVDYPVGVTPDSDAGRAFKSLAEGITRGDDPTQMTEAVRQAFMKGNTDPRYLEAVNRVLQQRPGADKFQFAPSSAGGLELQVRVDAKADGNTSFEPVPKGLNFEQAKKYGEMLGEVRNSDKPDAKSTFDNGLGNRIAELLKATPAAPPEIRQRILAGINREIQTKYPAYGSDMLSVRQNADGQGIELRQGNDKVLSTYGRQSTDVVGVGKVETPNGLNPTEAENYRNLLKDLKDPSKSADATFTTLNQNLDRIKADMAKLDPTQADLYMKQINDQLKAKYGDKFALATVDGKPELVAHTSRGDVPLPPGLTRSQAEAFRGLAERALDPTVKGSALGNDLLTALKTVDADKRQSFVDAFNRAYTSVPQHNGEYFTRSGDNLELNRKRGMLDFTSPVIEKFKGDAATAGVDNLLRANGFDNPGNNTSLDAIRKSFADLRANPGNQEALKTFVAGLKAGNFTETQMKAITDAFNQGRAANSRLDVSQLKDGVVKLGDMTVIAPHDKQLVIKGNLSTTDIADLKAVMERLNGGDSVRGSTDLLTKVMGSVKDQAVRDSILRGINDVLAQTQKNSMNKESIAFHPGGNGFDITTTDINNVKTTKWIKSNNVEVSPQDLATDTMNRLIQNPAAADAQLMVKALEGNPEQLARAVENVLSGDPNASAKLKALFQNGSDTTKRMIENRLAQLGDAATAEKVGITGPALESIKFAGRILKDGMSGVGVDVAKYLASITDPKVRTMVMDNLVSAINQKLGGGHTLEFNINNELLLKKDNAILPGSTVVERFASGVARDYTAPAAVPDTAAITATLSKYGITESNPVEAARKAQALNALADALKSPSGDVASALRVLRSSGLSDAQLKTVAQNINKDRGANDLQLGTDGKSLVFKVNGKEISVPENLSRDRMNLVGELARKVGTATADTSRAMGDQLKAILEGLPADSRKGLVDQLNGLTQNTGIKFNLAADGKNFTVKFNDKVMGARFDLAQPAASVLDSTQMSARLAEMGIRDVPPTKVEQVYRAIEQLKRDLTNPQANIGESARVLKSLGLNEQQLKAATDSVNASLGDKPIKLTSDGKLTFKIGEKSITLPDTLSPALMTQLQTLASELPTATKAQAEKMAQRLKPILDTLPAETRTQLLSQLNNLAPGRLEDNKGVRFNIADGKLTVSFDNAVLGKPTDLAQPPKDQPALPGELNLTARESQLLEQYRKLIDGPPPLKPPSGGSFHHALIARAKEMGITIPPAMLSALSTTLRDNAFAAAGRKYLTTADAATISDGKLAELLKANVPSTDVRAGDAQLGTIPPEIKNAEQLKAWLATEAGAATVRDALASNNPQDRLTLARNLAALGVKDFTVGNQTFKTEVTRNGKVTLSLAGTPDAPIARGTFNRNGFRNDASVTPGDKLNGINFKDVPIKINGVDVPKRSDNPLAATTIRDLNPDQAKAHLQEKYGISEADPLKAKELYTKIETARRDLATGKVDSVRELLAKLPTSGDGAARVIADLNSTAGTTPGALRINPETRNLEMRIGAGNTPADFVNLKSHPDSIVQDLVRLAKTNPELAKFKSDILNMPNDASRNEAIKALLGQFKNDPFKMNLALLETIKVLKPANMSLSDFANQYGDKLLPNNGKFHFDSRSMYKDLKVSMYDDTGKTKIGEFRIGEGNLNPTDSKAPVINRDVLTRTLDALGITKAAQADIYNRMDALRNAPDEASRTAAYKALLTTLDSGEPKVGPDKFAELASAFNNQNVLRFNETTKSLMIPGNPDINLRHVKAGNGLVIDFFAPAVFDEAQTAKFAEIMRGFRNAKITENLPLMADQLKGLSAPDRAIYIAEANRALKANDSRDPYILALDDNKLKVTNPGSWWGSTPTAFDLPPAPPATSTRLDATTLPADTTVGAPRILDRTAAIAAGEALFTNPKFNPTNPGDVPQKLGAILNALPPNERAQALSELQAKLRTAWKADPELAKIAFSLDPTTNRLTVGREVPMTVRSGGISTKFEAIGQPVQLSDKATPLATAATPIDQAAMKRDLEKYGIPIDANSEQTYRAILALKSSLQPNGTDVATALRALKALNLKPEQMTKIATDLNTGREGKDLRLSADGANLVIRVAPGKDLTVPPNLSDAQLGVLKVIAQEMPTATADKVTGLRDRMKAVFEQIPLETRKALADQLNALTPDAGIKFKVNPEGTSLITEFNKAAVGDKVTLGAPPVEQPAAAALTMPEMTPAQKAQFDLLKQLTAGGPLKPPRGGSFYQAIEQRAKALGLNLTHEQILPLAQALNKQFMVKGSVTQKDSTAKLTGDANGDARLARVILGEKVPLIGATPDAPGTRNELPANATREQIQTWLKSDAGAAALRNAFSGNPQESLKMARILAQAGIDKFTAKGPDNKDVTFTIKQQKSGNTTRVTLGRMDGTTETPVLQGDFGVRGAFKLNDTVAAQAFDVWKAFDWKKTPIKMDGIDVKAGTPVVATDQTLVPVDKGTTPITDVNPALKTAIDKGVDLFKSFNPENPGNVVDQMRALLDSVPANRRRDVLAEIRRQTTNRALDKVIFFLSRDGVLFDLRRAA